MRHEEEGSNQVSTHGRGTIPPLIHRWKKRRPGGEGRCSTQQLQSPVRRHLPQNPPGPSSENRCSGLPRSGQGAQKALTRVWAASPDPSPPTTPCHLAFPSHPCGLRRPHGIRLYTSRLYSLASLTTAIPSFACPPRARISRSRVCPSVYQPSASAGQHDGVHNGTVLVAAQIVSERRSWMSLALPLVFSAQTGAPPDCSPVAQVLHQGRVQLCPVSLRGREPLGPASPRPQP